LQIELEWFNSRLNNHLACFLALMFVFRKQIKRAVLFDDLEGFFEVGHLGLVYVLLSNSDVVSVSALSLLGHLLGNLRQLLLVLGL
jgi:hypothetical protein